MPTEALFAAVLIDAARADAPAREMGRVRLQPAGPAPYRFTIPYRDRDLTPGGRYADRVQELHIKVIHLLIELVERRLAPGKYS